MVLHAWKANIQILEYLYLYFIFVLTDPDLIYDKCLQEADGFEGTLDVFPPGHNLKTVKPELSGRIKGTQSKNCNLSYQVGLKGHNLLKLKPELSGRIKGNFEMTKNNFLVVLCYGCVVFVMVVIFCQSVPITTVVSSNPGQTRCTRCNIMWSSLSVTCGRSVVFSGYSSFLHQ